MPVTFRQLEIFVAAAEEANFRTAADVLGISQPGLSKQIQALEAALGRQLFTRRRGASAVLSAEGREMLARARDMLEQQKGLRALEEPLPRKVRVAAGEYLLDYVIKPALPELFAHFPATEFEFQRLDMSISIVDLVRSGQADLGIALSRPVAGSHPDIRVVCEAPCSLYVAAERAELLLHSKEAMAAEPLIVPIGSIAAGWVFHALKEAGVGTDRPTLQVQFGDVLADMIRQGKGMGVLFDEHAKLRHQDRIVPLPFTLPPVQWLLVNGPRLASRVAEPLLHQFAGLVGAARQQRLIG